MTDSTASADDADDYDDQAEDDPEGAAALDLAVNMLAGTVTGLSGYAVGGPAGAVISNAATPILAAVFRKAARPWWGDCLRRSEKMMETVQEVSGLSPEQLAGRAAESEESRFLTGRAVQAAANTIWPEGVRAIGRAYAAGLLAQDKPVLDIRLRVLGIMQDLDELHVSLLGLLVKSQPEGVWGHGWRAVPQRIPSYLSRHPGEDGPDTQKFWSPGERRWNVRQIIGVMPDLQPVLRSLLGMLQQSGLIQENDTAPAVVKRLGDDMMQKVNRQAERIKGGGPAMPLRMEHTVQADELSWSPTELGERVLAYYAEAGAEDGRDQG